MGRASGARWRPGLRSAWPWLLLPVAAGWGLLAAWVQDRAGQSWVTLVSGWATGMVLVGAGLRIRQARTANRCWWLLVAAGFAWPLGAFAPAGLSWTGPASFALVNIYYAFLVWAVLAYPTGRLVGRMERLLLATVIGVLIVQVAARVLLLVPPDAAGYGSRNWLLPIEDNRMWQAAEDFVAWTFTIAMAAILGTVIARRRRFSTPGRRMLTPLLVATAVLAVSVAVEFLVGWNTQIPGIQASVHLLRYWLVAAVALALALGVTRLQRSRASVVDVVGELGDGRAPAGLAGTLARALGDPALRLFDWSPTAGRFVDEAGRPAELPAPGGHRAVTLVPTVGEPVAALVHDAALLEDPGLVNGLVAAVRLTIDNERLRNRIQAQLDDVATSRARLLAEADAHRRQVERDLHDGTQQRLIAIALSLRLAQAQIDRQEQARLHTTISRAVADLGDTIDELRDLARGIHPAVLTESGLAVALESLADRSPLPVSLTLDLPAELPEVVAASGYFAAAEALTNVTKHSGAGRAQLEASAQDGSVRIVVRDDGRGGASLDRGTGLRGIADRLQAVGGTLRISSSAEHGTQVEIEVPCASS